VLEGEPLSFFTESLLKEVVRQSLTGSLGSKRSRGTYPAMGIERSSGAEKGWRISKTAVLERLYDPVRPMRAETL